MQLIFLESTYTISPKLGVSTEFELLKLKNCSLYHENLLLQKFIDVITQVLGNVFQPLTSWRLSNAVCVSILCMKGCAIQESSCCTVAMLLPARRVPAAAKLP